jgi:hypothetical protein
MTIRSITPPTAPTIIFVVNKQFRYIVDALFLFFHLFIINRQTVVFGGVVYSN